MPSVRSVFISDVHLGSSGAQVDVFNRFLSTISCECLYLNGDILDQSLIGRTHDLPENISKSISLINKIGQSGTRVLFLPGNHDSISFAKELFTHCSFEDEFIYESVNHKRFLLFHGHKLDPSILIRSLWFYKWGTLFYEWLLTLRVKKGQPSKLGKVVKWLVKQCVYTIFRYKKRLIRYVRDRQCDGVICGHSHRAQIEEVDGAVYINSGDWIFSCSYIVETVGGEFQLKKAA